MDLKDAREKKERGYTVKDVADGFMENHEGYSQAISVGITEDGSIDLYYSIDDDLRAIGVLDILKQKLIDGILEE